MKQKPGIYRDYVGTIVHFQSQGVYVALWLYVTGAGARYTPQAHEEPCLWIARYETAPDAFIELLLRAGFVDITDRKRYRAERLAIPVDEIRAVDPAERIPLVLARLRPLITALAGDANNGVS